MASRTARRKSSRFSLRQKANPLAEEVLCAGGRGGGARRTDARDPRRYLKEGAWLGSSRTSPQTGRSLAGIYGKLKEAASQIGKTGRGLAPVERRGVAPIPYGAWSRPTWAEGRGSARRAAPLSLRAPESGVTAA